MSGTSLYSCVIEVTEDYLGPAAERFIDRQIENHLHKDPTALCTKDLHLLIDWLRLAVSVITDDKQLVEEYTRRLQELKTGTKQSYLKKG